MADRSSYRGRFAPSPTGPLHLGSLVAALGSWLDARQHGGEWLIRIEDIDPPREVPDAARQQLATLAAFGMRSDQPVMFQHTRHQAYDAALARLATIGASFACSCSRRELEAADGIHHACLRAVDPDHRAIRLRVEPGTIDVTDRLRGHWQESPWDSVGDFVLLRADGCYAYQLAVVVDDAAQGITDVVRGADLLSSTARQMLLQRALDLPTPRYLHLPLVLDEAGRKLGKSVASCPIDADDPLPALREAWRLLGQDPHELAGTGSVDALLRRAVGAFRVAALPGSAVEIVR